MGANMTPTMKKSGRTVFGVKMGLSQGCQPSSSALKLETLHILPCLQSLLPKRRILIQSVHFPTSTAIH